MSSDAPSAQRQNQSVRKAAAILRAAAANPAGDTVTSLARAAGLPRATALRMVEALIDERLLARVADDRILIGPGVHALARSTGIEALVQDAAREPLERLAELTDETITLTVALPDGSLEIVQQLDGPHMLGLLNWVGRPFALHASSSGKLALAFAGETRVEAFLQSPLPRLAKHTITDTDAFRAELATIRAQGWSEIEDELEQALAAVSVGFALDGTLIGSVNVSGPTARLDAAARRALVPLLRTCCERIEANLGARRG